MNRHTLNITADMSQVAILDRIKEELKTDSSLLFVNLTHVGFRLTRDFFFVISQRFHRDRIILGVSNEIEVSMAKSLGLQSEIVGMKAEFDKAFEKKNILAHNMSMWEYFVYEVKRGLWYVRFYFVQKFFKKEKILHIRKTSPNLFLMITGLIISVTLLLFIFHFAVSKTFVHITPQISIRSISANIIYSLNENTGSVLQSKNNIAMKKVTLPVEYEMQFNLDTVDPNSTTNAQWTVVIFNELDADQALKPQTRFITQNGEVFRTRDWINVPASKTLNGITEIGSVEAVLIADGNDEAGKVIGQRGNIPNGTDLTIPGLKFNRDKVYAKAKEVFHGGADPKVHVVAEPEVKKFEGIVREQLYNKARERIQQYLDENKKSSGEDYALLMGDGVTFDNENVGISSGQKYGDTANTVSIKWSLTISALVYDRKSTIAYLTDIFREGLLRGTDKELGIHTDTLHMTNIVSQADDRSRIKATMEMTASITYDFENATNELTRHMKVLIAGLSKKEAISRLINAGHVKEVDISFSPFWIRNVSSNIDNIDFIIER
jgi:hypothetical protein